MSNSDLTCAACLGGLLLVVPVLAPLSSPQVMASFSVSPFSFLSRSWDLLSSWPPDLLSRFLSRDLDLDLLSRDLLLSLLRSLRLSRDLDLFLR